MNKIEVISEDKILNEASEAITSVNNDILTIDIKGNSNIILINKVYKDIVINILDNVESNIFELRDNNNEKYNYKYTLGTNSKVIVNKFNYSDNYSEDISVNLNGYEASIIFNLSVISLNHHIYNININHNNKKTISNVNNHGVTLNDASIDFVVNGTIKKGMINSVINQDNKIISMGNGKNTIKPNLFIDENMVEARHGASIGRFNEDEIFYLESRGIPKSVGYHLLMKGFLINKLAISDDIIAKLDSIIEKFRR
jgi:Fe-S cluster assembly protein SufD